MYQNNKSFSITSNADGSWEITIRGGCNRQPHTVLEEALQKTGKQFLGFFDDAVDFRKRKSIDARLAHGLNNRKIVSDDAPIKPALHPILWNIRTRRGQLIGEMAESLGMSAAKLSAIETGRAPCPYDFYGLVGANYTLRSEEASALIEAIGFHTEHADELCQHAEALVEGAGIVHRAMHPEKRAPVIRDFLAGLAAGEGEKSEAENKGDA